MSTAKQFFVFAVLIFTASVYADVKLSGIFGDHMVLQQNETVTVWGWADPGEKVAVQGNWSRSRKTTQANDDGQWNVSLKTPKAGKPQTLTITGNNEIVLKDVLLGEVWICSGQSNMQWRMTQLKTDVSKQDVAKADYPQIRLFTVKRVISTNPKNDVEGQWQICSPETVNEFSATGYYFGKKIHETLNVPIGLISTNWGGTKAEAWTSKETLADFEQFSEQLQMLAGLDKPQDEMNKNYQQELRQWNKEIAKTDIGTRDKWFAGDFDDSGWKEMTLPSLWTGSELEKVDGIVWYRRAVDLPEAWGNKDLVLHLGAIDDISTVWVNGKLVGTTADWTQKRIHRLSKSILKTGSNRIAVRVIDVAGDGGFGGDKGDMRIGPRNTRLSDTVTLAGPWRYQLSYQGSVTGPPMKEDSINQHTPSVLYNGMIAPLQPMRIAGAIWYQGESNCYDPIGYRTLFPGMISDWRTKWNQGEFPFYFVQIAPFKYNENTRSQALREAQMMTLDAVDNVGMAVTMDIGVEKNIHPANKHDVGDRLARWALAKTYDQKGLVHSGPIYGAMDIEDGKIVLEFDYTYDGLVAKDGKLTDFMIAGADKKFVPAAAVIDGETVVVSSNVVKEPVAVRYGWSNWVDGSLFNKAGLPASSFRTDDWPLE